MPMSSRTKHRSAIFRVQRLEPADGRQTREDERPVLSAEIGDYTRRGGAQGGLDTEMASLI